MRPRSGIAVEDLLKRCDPTADRRVERRAFRLGRDAIDDQQHDHEGQHERPDPEHVFDIMRAELAGLDPSDLPASLSQSELGDFAIFDRVRAPIAACEPEGHDVAFRFGEKSLAEFA